MKTVKVIVRFGAILCLGLSWFGFLILAEVVVPQPFGEMRVLEKSHPAPDRFRLSAKTDPNETGGTIGYGGDFPKWFYDEVEIGDWLITSYGHFRLVRENRVVAVYIPWHRWFPMGFIFIAGCLPMLVWLPKQKALHGYVAIGFAAILEVSLVSFFLWAIMNR